jgi:ATP-dependent helicase/nuclease subunit A
VFLPGGEKPLYEADYSPLKAHRTEAGNIGIYILDRNDSGDEDGGTDGEQRQEEQFGSDENEAVFTAEKIRDILAETNENGEAAYRPEDIAILFRSRGPQRVFEKHLRLLGIPYAGEGLSSFFADGPVNDMAAILRLVSYPLDTEAYAAYLRSPFAGLSLSGLAAAIAEFNSAKESGKKPAPFPDTVLPLLEEADCRAYEQGRDLYRRTTEKAAYLSIGELVSGLWYREGYRYETEWNPQTTVYRELFDYLYSQAVKADEENLSLAAFTDHLMALRENEERLTDTEIPLERPGAVRLLTIHKSKGLEFPVVFIVCCGKRARGNSNDEEIYASGDAGLSFNPPLPPECSRMSDLGRNFFYERDRLEERRKEAAELRRLLYVAMTRAEDRLVITGSCALGKEDREADIASRLVSAIEKKREEREDKERKEGGRRLPGDSSLGDGTLFGLLLPALADQCLAGGELPPWLSLDAIPRYTREELRRREYSERAYSNDRQGLSRFLADAAPAYEAARVLATDAPEKDHLSPASFRGTLQEGKAGAAGWRLQAEAAFSGEGGAELFVKVDRILETSAGSGDEGFGPAEFGTIAHLCVEAMLKGMEPAVPPRLAGRLSPGELEIVLRAGGELAERFLRSPLGKAAAASPFRRSEYSFRSFYPRQPSFYINGTIDLLFEWENEVWVVDFKTDSVENPLEHLPQMAFYYSAARDLREKTCRVWLYYLRTGHGVDTSAAIEAFIP